jgi:hypothetical protein
MRAFLGLLSGLTIFGLVQQSWADHLSAPALPISEIHFDDFDETAMQKEVAQQVLSFLNNLQTNWGKTEESVRGSIPGKVERDEHDQLVYARALAEHDVLEGYEFHRGGLVRGRYLVLQRPVNRLNEFIDYFGAVKQAVITTYGKPTQDRTVWENDLYQPLPEYWGVAVMIGYLRYAASWETPLGSILIELTGNHHSRLSIEYRQRQLPEDQKTTGLPGPSPVNRSGIVPGGAFVDRIELMRQLNRVPVSYH